MADKTAPNKDKLEFHPDAWARFEHAADVVAKSPPQHRARAKRQNRKTALRRDKHHKSESK